MVNTGFTRTRGVVAGLLSSTPRDASSTIGWSLFLSGDHFILDPKRAKRARGLSICSSGSKWLVTVVCKKEVTVIECAIIGGLQKCTKFIRTDNDQYVQVCGRLACFSIQLLGDRLPNCV